MAYPFQLPPLGFAPDAIEPHIDARTMEIHHGKHHAAYTANLNKALEAHPSLHAHTDEQLLRGIDSLPTEIRTAVRNNGGGFHNHALFWDILAPGGPESPSGSLGAAIDSAFGSFDDFKARFQAAAVGQFGSGWGWLSLDGAGKLACYALPNQDSPLMQGHKPILGVDVWEHAYYLHYQNRRPDYLAAIWNVVNWDRVAARYEAVRRP
jgi:Fe-Mn family superoxide dismutase